MFYLIQMDECDESHSVNRSNAGISGIIYNTNHVWKKKVDKSSGSTDFISVYNTDTSADCNPRNYTYLWNIPMSCMTWFSILYDLQFNTTLHLSPLMWDLQIIHSGSSLFSPHNRDVLRMLTPNPISWLQNEVYYYCLHLQSFLKMFLPALWRYDSNSWIYNRNEIHETIILRHIQERRAWGCVTI